MEVAFQLWHTGRRGAHFHVDIEPMAGSSIHKAQKEWVRRNVPGADLSIYNPTGQWRLPLTVHEKAPGKIKRLVAEYPGKPLKIPEYVVPPPVGAAVALPETTTHSLFMANLMVRRGEGQRTPHLFILACNAHELGLPLDTAIRRVLWWNERYASPAHGVDYVARKVDEVYRQRGS